MKLYDILSAGTRMELIVKVNLKLREGWTLNGGIAVVYYDEELTFYQAVSSP